jgi:aldehyde dehydrogenase (NAD+)
MASYTTDKDVQEAYQVLSETFRSGRTKSLAWRKWQLKQVWWLLEDNETLIRQSLQKDLNRHDFETLFCECFAPRTDVLDHLEHIDKWTADQKLDGSFLVNYLYGTVIRPEPRGLALIIGPWNFPVSLILQPMIAAISAGCTVLLKPSEVTTATQSLLVELIPKYMDSSAIRVVTGGAAETSRILERKFDHIFFTGSPPVARYVAAAAAKHLTPTVLELGGQAPAIVTKTADIDLAAKSIAWVKYLNAGQICLSVNHVFAHPDVRDLLVRRIGFFFTEFTKDGLENMTGIANSKNFERLKGAVENSSGTIAYGGLETMDMPKLHIRPTIISDVKPDGKYSYLSSSILIDI